MRNLKNEIDEDKKRPKYENGTIELSNGEIYSITTSGELKIEEKEKKITFRFVVACGGTECTPTYVECEAEEGMSWREWINSGLKGSDACSLADVGDGVNQYVKATGNHTESCPVVNNGNGNNPGILIGMVSETFIYETGGNADSIIEEGKTYTIIN
jgi:hypothetical protein